MPAYFITATGTGIGKTLITCALCHQLRTAGKPVRAIKPVISGWEEGIDTDTTLLLQIQNLPITPENIDATSPWRFTDPVSPDMAAARENKPIDFQKLISFCRSAITPSETLLIEGVGGAMVPLTPRETTLDWIAALNIPAIVIAGAYVGTLSHTLATIEALKSRGIPITALIVTESCRSAATLNETLTSLKRFIPPSVQVIGIPEVTATQHPWKHLPPLTGLLS